jgi:hypothetical protein
MKINKKRIELLEIISDVMKHTSTAFFQRTMNTQFYSSQLLRL